jgi:hypothetical protein
MASMDFETYGPAVRHNGTLPLAGADPILSAQSPLAIAKAPHPAGCDDASLIARYSAYDGQTLPALVLDSTSTDTVAIDMALAAEGKALVDELLRRVLADTDFLGDLTDDVRLVEANAARSVDMAAELWSDDHGELLPIALLAAAHAELVQQAHDMLEERAEQEAERIKDEIEAGDRDDFGRPILFPRYYGV